MSITDRANSEFLLNYNLLTFEEVDSTNEAAKRLARCGATGNFLVLGTEQTAGYGQHGRNWQSLKGNLHLSIMLETETKLETLQELVFLVSLVAAQHIESKVKSNCKIELKWPNDLMCNGRKLGGILLETLKVGAKQFVIIGIGLNLHKKPQLADGETACLSEDGGYEVTPEEFMAEFIKHFDHLYCSWTTGGVFTAIRKGWLDRAYNLNKTITIDNGQRRMSGIFREIDANGAIIVEMASGERVTLNYGELLI